MVMSRQSDKRLKPVFLEDLVRRYIEETHTERGVLYEAFCPVCDRCTGCGEPKAYADNGYGHAIGPYVWAMYEFLQHMHKYHEFEWVVLCASEGIGQE